MSHINTIQLMFVTLLKFGYPAVVGSQSYVSLS